MNAERLLTHFDRLAEATDAVARLRRFILDLAVRGKLVVQDPNDEPASELLKRIHGEKARLLKDGEIKKLESFATVGADEIPFSIPSGWEVVRMGWLARKLGAGSTPLGGKSVYQNEGVPFLRSQNVHNDGLRLDDVAFIARATHDRMSGTHVQKQDILLNITGASIGRCALVPEAFVEGNVSQHVAIVRLFLPLIREFIHLSLTSPFFQKVIDDVQVGVSREGLSMQRLKLFPMLIPSLREQRRIVAKVNELMACCDRLEAAQAQRERRRDRLTSASLHRLSRPDDDAKVFRAHARFHLCHLPRFTVRPDQIPAFRETILNLAVRGRLVPQDPNDEPAKYLLDRIQAGRNRLLGEKEERRNDFGASVDGVPFHIPGIWQWTRLQDLIIFGPQNGISPKPTSRPDAPKAITLSATTKGRFDAAHFKHVEANIGEDSDFWLRPGDLLFQRGNTREYVGIAAYYDGDPGLFLYPDLIMKVRLTEKVSLKYIHFFSIAPDSRSYFSANASGAQATMPKINQTTLVGLPIALPPFAEQRRIVAKVDELMAVCDRLESQLATAQTEGCCLLESVLHAALAPASEQK